MLTGLLGGRRRRLFSATSASAKDLYNGIISGNRIALAQAITLVESKLYEDVLKCRDLFGLLEGVKRNSMRIGLSGSPGVGKSSLIEKLGIHCTRKEGLKASVLTVDPSSTISGGSILGDKTRMSALTDSADVFIRSSPSCGQLGGVSRGTFMAINLCEKAGYDVIFIESVGVGQSETQLADLTDVFVLCSAPMAGDDLQAMKRGINERADLILLNKADEPLSQVAKKALMALKASQTLRSNPAKVLPVSALTGSGIELAWSEVQKIFKDQKNLGQLDVKRRDQMHIWLKSFIRDELDERFLKFYDSSNLRVKSIPDALEASTEFIEKFCQSNLDS